MNTTITHNIHIYIYIYTYTSLSLYMYIYIYITLLPPSHFAKNPGFVLRHLSPYPIASLGAAYWPPVRLRQRAEGRLAKRASQFRDRPVSSSYDFAPRCLGVGWFIYCLASVSVLRPASELMLRYRFAISKDQTVCFVSLPRHFRVTFPSGVLFNARWRYSTSYDVVPYCKT